MPLIRIEIDTNAFNRLYKNRCGDCDKRALIEGPWEEATVFVTCNACGAIFKLHYFNKRLESAVRVT